MYTKRKYIESPPPFNYNWESIVVEEVISNFEHINCFFQRLETQRYEKSNLYNRWWMEGLQFCHWILTEFLVNKSNWAKYCIMLSLLIQWNTADHCCCYIKKFIFRPIYNPLYSRLFSKGNKIVNNFLLIQPKNWIFCFNVN